MKANRRLLLIGSIYEKNKDLTDYSKSNAQKLGDTDIVKKVDEGSAMILNSQIVEKLTKEDPSVAADPETAKEIAELKEELKSIIIKDKEERKESTEKVEKEVAVIRQEPPEEKFDSPNNLVMKVSLSDGRSIQGKTILFEDEKINVSTDTFSSKLPATLLSEIIINNNPNLKNPPIAVQLKNGKIFYGFKLRKSEDDFSLQNRGSQTEIELDSIQKISIR